MRPIFLSILIPTFNEAENIQVVLRRIKNILDRVDLNCEVIVIDDNSLDGTADLAKRELEETWRVIERKAAKNDLSLSIFEGIKESRGDTILIMDGDGSHPPETIPDFLKAVGEGCDLVIGSRYVPGGSSKGFPFIRRAISRFTCLLGRLVTSVKDNSSGFFCVRRSALEGVNLTPTGFKIGLEVFVKAKFNKVKEIPYIFVNRVKGKSKFRLMTVIQYLYQLACLLKYKHIDRLVKRCI